MSDTATVSVIDLSVCDREPIHVPGSIQPHGALFACQAGSDVIAYCSANAAAFAGLAPDRNLAGSALATVLGESALRAFESAFETVPRERGMSGRVHGFELASAAGRFDGTVHEHNGLRIYEIERACDAAPVAPLDLVRTILGQLQQAKTLRDLCDQTARLVRDLIGFDRVMIYRFLEDGAGHVISESRADNLEPLLNLRYPASDIPKQARELYKSNWIRLIADVMAAPVPLAAHADMAAKPLDLSFSGLRSVSPIHIEYLRNMKVGASMSISIIAGGELWGLIACHHRTGKCVPANVRAAAELLGQVFSLQIQTVEGIEAYVTMRAARALLDRIVAEFPIDGDLIENLSQRLEALSAFIRSDGVGLWMDGLWRGFGATPPMTEVAALAAFITGEAHGEVYATQHLAGSYPRAAAWPGGIAGLLAVPLSHNSGDFLLFFRKEVAQTIDWGGNPNKPVAVADQAPRLSPRKSFETWREDVRGQSLPWTSRERLIADTLRIYLLDVIVRFSEVILDERRKSQRQAKALTSELNHRVKGTLELIQSLVARGAEEKSIPGFVRTLEGRIGAIALAHGAISTGDGPQVRQLFASAAASHKVQDDQIELSGPDLRLDAKAYTVLALVVHELFSNATQYGALAVPQGHVGVRWLRDISGRMTLYWEEVGGLPIRAVVREGLGLNIIRRNIPHALGGEAEIDLERGGLKAKFSIPARYLAAAGEAGSHNAYSLQAAAAHRPLEGFALYVLDDQMLTAMDLQEGLLRLGAQSVRTAGTVETSLQHIAEDAPDAAVLDVDLEDGYSFAVADELNRLSIPFVFMANDAERRIIPERFADVAVIAKPLKAEDLADRLRDALMPNLIRAVLNKLV